MPSPQPSPQLPFHPPASRLLGSLLALVLAVTGVLAGGTVLAAGAARAADCPSSGGARVPQASASGEVVFRGHGWGHGLGMSQYGAQGAARLGCSAAQILTRYYAGTTVDDAAMPRSVLVRMLSAGYRVDAEAVSGSVRWALQGCTADCPPRQPKGATWQLRLADNASYQLFDLSTLPKKLVWQGGARGSYLYLQHSGTVVDLTTWSGSSIYLHRQLRWDYTRFSIRSSGSQRLDAVQVIRNTGDGPAMDKYLWGLAEVPISWTNGAQEALKAQAIAARTYATKRSGSVLMPTPADQNYTGYAKESEDASYRDNDGHNLRWKQAVDSTSGQVVKDASSGALIDTLYTSSVGGWSEDDAYVWHGSTSFLAPVDDSRWEMASSNPSDYRSWAKGFSFAQLAGKFGFTSISAISVPRRGSPARTRGVKITGVRSGNTTTTYVDGWDVRQALGLKSPGFEILVPAIGGAGATPIAGDWDGDGTADPGWFRDGRFALRTAGGGVQRFTYGRRGDLPVVGDWDGDGTDDVGVFRRGHWFLRSSTGGAEIRFKFGLPGDTPVAGSWNGTDTGIGVVRRGQFYLHNKLGGGRSSYVFHYGRASDVPVVGDWDGDGVTTPGVRRGRRWFLRNDNSGGGADRTFGYGLAADRLVAGDWDGNVLEAPGVVRNRTFYLRADEGQGKRSQHITFAG